MALIRNTLSGEGDEMMGVTLKQRTCADGDGKAVPAGDPRSETLVGPAGARVTDEKAERLGLVNGTIPGTETTDDAPADNDTGAKADEPGGDKAHHGPVEDKSAKKKRGRPRKRNG